MHKIKQEYLEKIIEQLENTQNEQPSKEYAIIT